MSCEPGCTGYSMPVLARQSLSEEVHSSRMPVNLRGASIGTCRPATGKLQYACRLSAWWQIVQGRSGQGEGDRATAAAQLLVTTALNKGTRDNITAIVGLFEWR